MKKLQLNIKVISGDVLLNSHSCKYGMFLIYDIVDLRRTGIILGLVGRVQEGRDVKAILRGRVP